LPTDDREVFGGVKWISATLAVKMIVAFYGKSGEISKEQQQQQQGQQLSHSHSHLKGSERSRRSRGHRICHPHSSG